MLSVRLRAKWLWVQVQLQSLNSSAIDVKMDGSVFEEKSYFNWFGTVFFSLSCTGAPRLFLLLRS